ncbi:MAG: PKD domain-containing protein, partial [Bacteroidota bacterium]|nr:PKD domain-containing protein [Bacteroidota bacterium]
MAIFSQSYCRSYLMRLPFGSLVFFLLFLGGMPLYGQLNADFTVNVTSGCSPLIISFTNQSTGSPVAYQWDFGNGNTSTNASPGVVYTTEGTFNVRLIVTDGSGNKDTALKTGYITVYKKPAAGFETNKTTGCTPLTVQFTDTSVTGSIPVSTWQWDFGDGSLSSQQNPSHTYASAGNFSVTLIVTDAQGCSHTIVRSSYIKADTRPQASFYTGRTEGCGVTHSVRFFNNSLNTVAGKTTYAWDFGDGSTSNLASPTHTYTAFGSYDVKLKVTIDGGCADSVTLSDYINIRNYTYDFKASDTAGCGVFPIQFTNMVSPDMWFNNYTWDFGDGNTSTSKNPVHAYLNPGTYTVKLFIQSNDDSCHRTVTKTNYISIGVPPAANFTADDSSACEAPLNVSFTDQSTDAVSWLWDFGDGSTSTQQNPSHTYSSLGQYSVRLIVRNAESCPDTLIKTDYILLEAPAADFISPEPFGCKSANTVLFFDRTTSPTPIAKWTWFFGDGDSAITQNSFHEYDSAGNFTITLAIETQDGCRDTFRRTSFVSIGNKPTADFTATPRDSCMSNLIVAFTNLSTLHLPAPDRYEWNMGNGDIINTTSPVGPVYSYDGTDPGFYTVRLIVFSNGCSDTLEKVNHIRVRGPKAQFTVFQEPCREDSVFFINGSLGANKFLWNFGDGDTSVLRHPFHKYNGAGTYPVRLTTFDTLRGCTHIFDTTIIVPNVAATLPGFV